MKTREVETKACRSTVVKKYSRQHDVSADQRVRQNVKLQRAELQIEDPTLSNNKLTRHDMSGRKEENQAQQSQICVRQRKECPLLDWTEKAANVAQREQIEAVEEEGSSDKRSGIHPRR